jgi:hypothetical protein
MSSGLNLWIQYSPLELLTVCTGAKRGMHNMVVIRDQRGIGIKRVLEHRTQHYPIVRLKYVFGTIAMVNVEIDTRDPFKARSKGMGCAHRDVVEDTEPHRAASSRMVSRRSDAAEYCVGLAMYYHIDSLHHGAGGTVGGFEAIWPHHCVRIEHRQAGYWCAAFYFIQIFRRVHPTELFTGCAWRVKPLEQAHQTGGNKCILDCVKTVR